MQLDEVQCEVLTTITHKSFIGRLLCNRTQETFVIGQIKIQYLFHSILTTHKGQEIFCFFTIKEQKIGQN
jgi:hypothetical protein